MGTDAANTFVEQIHSTGAELNAEQAMQALQIALGDTTAPAVEAVSVPNTEAVTQVNTDPPPAVNANPVQAQEAAGQTQAAPTEAELNAQNAVILAKDGKHTISYQKLVEARTAAAASKQEAAAIAAQLDEANRKLAALQSSAAIAPPSAQAQANIDAAQAAIDGGADPALFGDFSEESLAAGIKKVVEAQVAAQVAKLTAQMSEQLQPIQAKAAQDATQAHYQAIYQQHPDADSIAESQEFSAWRQSLPSLVRGAYDHALTQGSAEQINEVFSAFKQAQAPAQQQGSIQQGNPPSGGQAQSPEAIKAAAKAAVQAAASNATPPNSLSDIPGAGSAVVSPEPMRDLDPMSALNRAMNMTPEQLAQFMNSIL